MADCQPHLSCFGDSEDLEAGVMVKHRTLGFMCILLLVLAACFGGAACLTFWRPGYKVTDIYVGVRDKLSVMRTCPVAVWIS